MPQTSEVGSISQNIPARSDHRLDALGQPTNLFWSTSKFNFPNALESGWSPAPPGNKSSFRSSPRQHIDNTTPTAFTNTKTVVAVDVSGSTRGKVIEEEIKAAQSICGNLSEAAAAQTTVIPWDHRLHGFTTIEDATRLGSYGGGTKPSALTSSLTAVRAIRNCSAWMLFTDGEIVDREIRDFSRGLCTNGLHGTTCIIVLFGRRYQKPVDCNISVGVSIFGMVPNCLFLFHDVDGGTVSILQSKGIFNKLLPEGYGTLSLDDHSDWYELPTMSYGDLSQIDIPTPRKLEPGDILLQSNRSVRLNDIYNDKVDAVTASELLEVEDNLKTLLLTSEINGQRDSVKTWIANQRMKSRDMLHIPRPDVGSEASTYIRELFVLGTRTKDLEQKRSLQTKLRTAHKQNWNAFISNNDAERTRVSKREAVVHSALDRVTSNAVESSQSSWSARMLAPIVPGSPKKSLAGLSTGSTLPPAQWPVAKSQVPAKESCQPASSSTFPTKPLPKSFQLPLSRPEVSTPNAGHSPMCALPNTDILFIQGYKHNRGSDSMAAFKGECSLCGDLQAILALLVKEPSTGLALPGFPEPNSRAMLEFPLVIGARPGSRIISSFVCCEACAYYLVNMKRSPYGENIVGAIPLIQEALSGEFQQVTLDTLDNAFSKRFETVALEQIFLSNLYSLSMEIEEERDDIAKKALHWAASLLATSISMPSTVSTNFMADQTNKQGYIALRTVLSNNLETLSRPSPPILQYPIVGFVVLIRCMIDLKLDPSTVLLKKAVFQRILYHIAEKYHDSLRTNGRGATINRMP